MAILSYRCTEDNGLSFELLVDGVPLGKLVGSRDTVFPYWIVEDGLPHCPPFREQNDREIRIVCVCSCGEYGCGHTRCRVIEQDDEVVFNEFDVDVSVEGNRMEFRFPVANYETVCREISTLARNQCKRDKSNRT